MTRLHIGLLSIFLFTACDSTPDLAERRQQLLCQDTPPAQLTFRKEIRSKQFIGPIPLSACGIGAVLGPGARPGLAPAYLGLCTTAGLYRENPNGEESPHGSRLFVKVGLEWTCQQGSSVPVSASINVGTPVAGFEGPFEAVVNPVTTRNSITSNGEFAYVLSGYPSPYVEPVFRMFGERRSSTIWHRVTGRITCSTDSAGAITTQVTAQLTGTKFPSHRAYFYNVVNGQAQFESVAAEILQQDFSNLWNLAPVEAP